MRVRHQAGWVETTDTGLWRGHWYSYVRDPESGKERRCHHSRVLGNVRTMRKFEAKKALQQILTPVNATRSTRPDDGVTLRWFAENRWLPFVQGNWRESTKKVNGHFVRLILGKFGDVALRDLDKVALQMWLNELAQKFSRSTVWHVATLVKAICAEATEQDYLAKDPARKLKRPLTADPDATVLEWPQYQAVIDAAPTLRDKLLVKVACALAPRPGELCGFRWSSFQQQANGRCVLNVSETVYKSKLRPFAKTKNSKNVIAVPQRLAAELLQWRGLTQCPGDSDFIFPNCQGGFLDYENWQRDVLAPIGKNLNLRLNFQILRRTFATLAVGGRKGTVKDVQSVLRHTRPDTTLENYVKELPESVHKMVDSMYEGIAGAAVTGSKILQ